MDFKNSFKQFSKYFLRIFGIFLAVLFLFCLIMVIKIVHDADDIDIDSVSMNFSSIIYAKDPKTGEYVEYERLYDEENRTWVDFENISPYMKKAIVAIEDERFYSHHGIDIGRTIKATANFIFKGDSSYGGSTITQQLVKNITKDDARQVPRKIREIYRALKVESDYEKDDILELYLNTIYLSQQCNGVQAASNLYFDKDAKDLTLAEAACLAGITQYPTKYDPLINFENNKEKQKIVLSKMLELGYITQGEYENALVEELKFVVNTEKKTVSSNSYFVDAVIEEVLEDLQTECGYTKQIALKKLYSGGLKIYSTVNPDIQGTMEDFYEDESNFPKYPGDTQPESSMVIIDPYTGHIVGLVGGRGEKLADRTLNRATQTLRQPGSSIKPIAVYAPAIEYGVVSPATAIANTPVTYNGWTPHNSDHSVSAYATVREAVRRSLNIPAVRVLDKLGIDNSFDFLTDNLAISSLVESRTDKNGKVFSDKNLSSLSLGGLTDGVTVLEMCAAYTPFANKGIYTSPTTYTEIKDYDNNVLIDNDPSETNIAMSETTAFLITDMLCDVVSGGTGGGAGLSSCETAGKTGTTTGDIDRWFVGYTPYYVGAVWFGYDEQKSLPSVGYNPAVSVWNKIMTKVHSGVKYKKFTDVLKISGLSQASICSASGKRATELCSIAVGPSKVSYDWVTSSAMPTESCDVHKPYTLCAQTRMQATDSCPEKINVSATDAQETADEEAGIVCSLTCNVHSNSPIDENPPQNILPPVNE